MRYLLVLLLIISAYSLEAQIETNEKRISASVVNTQFKGSFLPIGLILEQKVGKNQVLFIQAKMVNHYFPRGNGNGQLVWQYGLAGQVRLEYKNYFNLNQRAERGNSTYNNSGLYLGVLASYKTGVLTNSGQINVRRFYSPKLSFGPIFGVQKTFDNNISIDYAVGPGIIYREGFQAIPGVVGHIIFSYVFLPNKNKQKKRASDEIYFDE